MRLPAAFSTLLLSCFALAPASPAAERWISVRSPHFEMNTSNSEQQAGEALLVFEQVRSFFLANNHTNDASQARVQIVAFSSEASFRPYRLSEGAFAYYFKGRTRDYIAMQDIQKEHHRVAVHEYTHLIVEHLGMRLPIWLNEGMADLYSSLEPHGNGTMIGRLLDFHIVRLQEGHLLPWKDLFAVTHDSPYYREPEKMRLFYAQSWLIVHMLNLSPQYRPGYSRFLQMMANGHTTVEAFSTIYSKTLDQVGQDVDRYGRQASVKAAIYDFTLDRKDFRVTTAPLPEFDKELALVELLTAQSSRYPEAERRLQLLADQRPDDVEVSAALGYVALSREQMADARKWLGNAVRNGSRQPSLLYDYAQLEHAAGGHPEESLKLVRLALSLEPSNLRYRITLAQLEAERGDCPAALAALAMIRAVPPESAYRFFSIGAYCSAQTRADERARTLGTRALEYAATPDEREQVERLLKSLEPATAHR